MKTKMLLNLRFGIALLALSGGMALAEDAAVPNGSPTAQGLPRTAQTLTEKDDRLRFAVVGDRAGGHRPGVFEHAMDQINLLQPRFVISVGDHIEGYTEDRAELDRQWNEVDTALGKLEMPFFRVVGNHDMGNPVMRQVWNVRFGRDYYHFVVDGVLFIALNTEDPPKPRTEETGIFAGYERAEILKVYEALQGDSATQAKFFAENPRLAKLGEALAGSESISISRAQVDYVKKALADNRNVKWTVLLMHRPAWRGRSSAFSEIEAMLADRPYTVLAGHYHSYSHDERNGRDYIVMGTTGGMQGANPNSPNTMDHVMLVTMEDKGPRIANIKLNGLYDRKGPSGTKENVAK